MYLNKSDLTETCRELLDEFDGVLTWKWDGGFNALLAEIPTEREDEVRTIIGRHLNQEWDRRSIRKAPDKLRRAAGDFSDLRANQLLLTSDPEGDIFVFAAWWPWGNGEKISVRLAAPSSGQESSEKEGFFTRVINIFK